MEIRPLQPGEVPTLQKLAETIWRAHYPSMISPEQIDYMLGHMYGDATLNVEFAAGVCYYAAWEGERMIGYLSLEQTERPGHYDIHKIYVAPQSQGRGVAPALLAHALAKQARCARTDPAHPPDECPRHRLLPQAGIRHRG